MNKTNTPFRYDYVGSFLRPAALKQARADFQSGRIDAAALKAVEDDAIRDLVAKQKAAGYHVITDGEFRRATWHLDFMWGFHGVGHTPTKTGLPFQGEAAMLDDTYLTGKVSVDEHPFVEHFRFVKALEDENTVAKLTIPAPAQFLEQMVMPFAMENTKRFYPSVQELMDDLAAGYRKVIADVYAAGCRNLQFDDCSWGMLVDPRACMIFDTDAKGLEEIKEQMLEKEGRLPDAVIACVGGGSNAIGSFYNFIEDKDVRLIGCEAAGRGIDTFETAATINTGRLGIFHGMKSYFCQDEYGQIAPVYSISAGLDYPGIGPEHAWLHDIGRAEYVAITDDEAVNAFEYLARTEGIIPAIESAHAVAHAIRLAPTMDKDQIIVITISGRGDKDCAAIARYRGEDLHE